MPIAKEDFENKIIQYIGTTTSTYTNGHFYKCVSDGQTTPTYSWEEVNLGNEVIDTFKVLDISGAMSDYGEVSNLNYEAVRNYFTKLYKKIKDENLSSLAFGFIEKKYGTQFIGSTGPIDDTTTSKDLTLNIILPQQFLIINNIGQRISSSQKIILTINNRVVTNIKLGQKSAHNYCFLKLNNTTAWTPTGNYNPATKKYVDDKNPQVATLPTASSELLGKIYQYIGSDETTYTNGHFYKCVSDGETPATYSWEEIGFGGDKIGDLDNLTTEDKSNLVAAINEVNAKIGDINEVLSHLVTIPEEEQAVRDLSNLVDLPEEDE